MLHERSPGLAYLKYFNTAVRVYGQPLSTMMTAAHSCFRTPGQRGTILFSNRIYLASPDKWRPLYTALVTIRPYHGH